MTPEEQTYRETLRWAAYRAEGGYYGDTREGLLRWWEEHEAVDSPLVRRINAAVAWRCLVEAFVQSWEIDALHAWMTRRRLLLPLFRILLAVVAMLAGGSLALVVGEVLRLSR